jgi:hypothetical protein
VAPVRRVNEPAAPTPPQSFLQLRGRSPVAMATIGILGPRERRSISQACPRPKRVPRACLHTHVASTLNQKRCPATRVQPPLLRLAICARSPRQPPRPAAAARRRTTAGQAPLVVERLFGPPATAPLRSNVACGVSNGLMQCRSRGCLDRSSSAAAWIGCQRSGRNSTAYLMVGQPTPQPQRAFNHHAKPLENRLRKMIGTIAATLPQRAQSIKVAVDDWPTTSSWSTATHRCSSKAIRLLRRPYSTFLRLTPNE